MRYFLLFFIFVSSAVLGSEKKDPSDTTFLSLMLNRLNSTLSYLPSLPSFPLFGQSNIAPMPNNNNKPPFIGFDDFKQACATLPKYRDQKNPKVKTILSYTRDFSPLLTFFFEVIKKPLLNEDNWLIPLSNPKNFFCNSINKSFPFVQKIILPPGSTLYLKGDLHGDIHSLLLFLTHLKDCGVLEQATFKIKDSKTYLVFLGDYTDRGIYGIEVLYTLMQLKIHNPDQVLLVQGNHENYYLNKKFGFIEEFNNKFEHELMDNCSREFKKLCWMYDFLPVALFIGCGENPTNYVLCCHGGMELGHDPNPLLSSPKAFVYQELTELKRKTRAQKDTLKPHISPYVSLKDTHVNTYPSIGYQWSDVSVYKNGLYHSKRGNDTYKFGKDITLALFKEYEQNNHQVVLMIRGHQHKAKHNSPLMHKMLDPLNIYPEYKGMARLWMPENSAHNDIWKYMVCTLLVSPDTPYGQPYIQYTGFDFDTHAILTLHNSFNDWSLKVKRLLLYN